MPKPKGTSNLQAPQVKEFEERALPRLREKGFRITMPRVQVVRAFEGHDQLMTAYRVHERIVNNGGKIDVVSCYRILETLRECGLVYELKEGFVKRESGIPLEFVVKGDQAWHRGATVGELKDAEVLKVVRLA